MLTIKELDHFCILLKEINMNFDLTALTYQELNKGFPPKKLNWKITQLNAHQGGGAGGALHYNNKRLSYNPANDLNTYILGKLESIFTEIVCLKSSSIIFLV